MIGLEAAPDPARGLVYGQRVFGKRIAELIRYNGHVQGFAPWFQNFTLMQPRCGLNLYFLV